VKGISQFSYEASVGAVASQAILLSIKKIATRHVLTQQCHVLSPSRNR
jgi:hypothetical protein